MKNVDTVGAFEVKKEKVNKVLSELQEYLQTGQSYGLVIGDDTIQKVKDSIANFNRENNELNVALIGAFSEGKTTIAAAWTGKLDKSSMKINLAESSDKVEIYDVDNKIKLVDTPGLFGSGSTEDDIKYRDITEKYVSEAHLVLYVMNPENPIKASHKEELVWLFKDLGLLPRTIFVLGRFDEVADVEDEEDYKETYEVKRDTVIESLREFDIISGDEEVDVVAVSANPFDAGIDYWLQNKAEYERLSHIKILQETTAKKVSSLGSTEEILLETNKSIIKDVVTQNKDEISEAVNKLNKLVIDKKDALAEIKSNHKEDEDKITRAQKQMREYLNGIRKGTIADIRSSVQETLPEIVHRQVGENGEIIKTDIENELRSYVESINNSLDNTIDTYVTQVSKTEKLVTGALKEGISKLSLFKFTNNSVLAIRDVVASGFKFKPWGAIKLASGLNNAIPIIGAAVSIFGYAKEINDNVKFEEDRERLANAIEEIVNIFLEIVNNDEEFKKSYFPKYLETDKIIVEQENGIHELEKTLNDIEAWQDRGKQIEKEYAKLLQG
ncbi:hypothetical protein G8B22_09015 [Ligilactobacillus agilis]|uniref:LeoA/HP0731 family dynamin-like GTPase n=1 Tax=Ligilactobacillus agilis TaxID=1601 RepID=UPI00067E7B5F|nr:LeoA/HP0731 family dynamin-like GTPase [Ligilactobacillus agilis]UNL43263.1 hypothetical protein G8B22_09015 [Ligilactobacillus agilis]UNL57736.1 hypothetical protein G8B19_02680 [Ligilactobacillus agilis]